MADALTLTFELKSSGAAELLDDILRRTGDVKPALAEVGEYMVNATIKRFEGERDPAGHFWAGLSIPYVARKVAQGFSSKIGQRTGALLHSFFHRETDTTVTIATNVHGDDGYPYPIVFQKGREDGTQPAREFFGVNQANQKAMEGILRAFIEEGP